MLVVVAVVRLAAPPGESSRAWMSPCGQRALLCRRNGSDFQTFLFSFAASAPMSSDFAEVGKVRVHGLHALQYDEG